jgi:hypothetical protein
MKTEIPLFARRMLSSPPQAGTGVHFWLYSVARQLHAHLPAVEIVALLERSVAGCGRNVPRHEIVSAVQSALTCAWQPNGSTTATPTTTKWPVVNQERRKAIIIHDEGVMEYWQEMTRIALDDGATHAEEIVDRLFPDNPLLCCGKANSVFDTKPRDEWRGELSTLALIVPSPMTAVIGMTKDGRESKHTLANTGVRRFLICEFDTGTTEEHAAILIHLARFAPLVCVVHSGGKSLHGWFFVAGQPEVKVEKFFRYAVTLGADHATWSRSQFVRMPDGTRDNGNRQTVYFLNFKPLEQAR